MESKNGQLVINGLRWFDKVNGNTYHAVQVFVDGGLVAQQGLTYGYGDHYRQTAEELLKANGYKLESPYLRENFKSVLIFCHDVPRKRDLNF